MYFHSLFLIGILSAPLFVAGCDSEPNAPVLDGDWTGSYSFTIGEGGLIVVDESLAITLTVEKGEVRGTGTRTTKFGGDPPYDGPLHISGTVADETVLLSLNRGTVPDQFEGLLSATDLTGTLRISEIEVDISLVRQ